MSNIHNIVTQNLKILEIKLARIRSVADHAATKGTLLEKAVCDFFQTMLPNSLRITSGFIIDSNGNCKPSLFSAMLNERFPDVYLIELVPI